MFVAPRRDAIFNPGDKLMEIDLRDLVWGLFIISVFGMFYLQNQIHALEGEMEIKHDDISELQDYVGMFDKDINGEDWKV